MRKMRDYILQQNREAIRRKQQAQSTERQAALLNTVGHMIDEKISAAIDRYDVAIAEAMDKVIDDIFDQLADVLGEEFRKTDRIIEEIRTKAIDDHITGKAVEDKLKWQLASGTRATRNE